MTEEHRWIAHGLLGEAGRYLFLRRRQGRYAGGSWDIPGGTVEHGEVLEEAAVRECLEETGIVAVVRGKLSTFDNADTEGRPIRFHTVTFALEAIGPLDSVRLSPLEHDQYRWATFAEATAELELVWHVRRTLELLRAFR